MIDHIPVSEYTPHKHIQHYVEFPAYTGMNDMARMNARGVDLTTRAEALEQCSAIRHGKDDIEQRNTQEDAIGVQDSVTMLTTNASEQKDDSQIAGRKCPDKSEEQIEDALDVGMCSVSMPINMYELPEAVRKLEHERIVIRRRSSMQIKEYATMVTLAALYSLLA
ncbi:hypothetical protein SARC_13288 [Sphaeroforma arctica JP610]|uniref:Uncharacterized protein n=1 Tax=Sphaeroforma arctica JP610 TaxID=667725 RepID=A0A0L0FBN3_9EUKA|nr:hypothetical protein SARC_13288 [Sphaeroforma arctica JP610]KNC74155.1 hypothetical protein SARC_13288 [Sphaeroforma arctica JP610]|eukprot:XP_014148057.1 hypothetical protein SARC_13288 [Sphaeroforma arctica JP610]